MECVVLESLTEYNLFGVPEELISVFSNISPRMNFHVDICLILQ